jgi:tetratricopeptide (TPR) repeat protein
VAWHVQIIKPDTQRARALNDEADALRAEGKLDEAISTLEEVILHLPNDADAHFKLASVLAESKQWDRSAKLYAVALERFGAPLWPGPWYEAIRSDEVFTRLRALRPKDRLPSIVRARLHVLLGDWNRAAADYARVSESLASRELSELVPEADDLIGYACLLLMLADYPGYEQFCKTWANRVGDAPGWEYSLARAWGLSARPVVSAPQIVEWAKKPVEAARNPWHLHVLSLAHYRNGQFDLAIQHADESNAGSWRGGAKSLNWLVLAMAHHRLGDVEKARMSLEQARLLVGRASSAQSPGVGLPDMAPPDVLEFELLYREAENLINPIAPEKPND